MPGAAWQVDGQTRVAFAFATVGELITEVQLVADADVLNQLVIEPG